MKYQLKYNELKEELKIVYESNKLTDLLLFVKTNVNSWDIKFLSVWMDGKVLNNEA